MQLMHYKDPLSIPLPVASIFGLSCLCSASGAGPRNSGSRSHEFGAQSLIFDVILQMGRSVIQLELILLWRIKI